MRIRMYDVDKKSYVNVDRFDITRKNKETIRSLKKLKRTPLLIYIIEFLKCDGTISIVRKGSSHKGETLFISTEKEYCRLLEEKVKRLFRLRTFERKDGFGISSLDLAVFLASKYNIPIGKKEEMVCISPKNKREAEMIIRATIDAEGNVDPYSGDITLANKSKRYLNSIREVLNRWFSINAKELPITYGITFSNRIGILKDEDVLKICKLGLFSKNKQQKLDFIKNSLSRYYKERSKLNRDIKNIIKQPTTIKEISNKLDVAPFVVRRILRGMKARKRGFVYKNKRRLILWSL